VGRFYVKLAPAADSRIGWDRFNLAFPCLLRFRFSGFYAALPRKLAKKSREFRPVGSRSRRENIFGAFKNQAGWGGFVASDLARCRHSDPERIASRDPMAARLP
jgi:hypothetical protein